VFNLDDTAWTDVPAFSDFTQKEPDSGAAPSEATRLRIAYDDNDLWIAIDCDQAGAERIARLTRRDRVLEDDRITIDLDTRDDGKSAFHFEVNAAGMLLDAIRFDQQISEDGDLMLDWDENWDARTTTGTSGWTAEVKIPFRVLRFEEDAAPSWGLTRCPSRRTTIPEPQALLVPTADTSPVAVWKTIRSVYRSRIIGQGSGIGVIPGRSLNATAARSTSAAADTVNDRCVLPTCRP